MCHKLVSGLTLSPSLRRLRRELLPHTDMPLETNDGTHPSSKPNLKPFSAKLSCTVDTIIQQSTLLIPRISQQPTSATLRHPFTFYHVSVCFGSGGLGIMNVDGHRRTWTTSCVQYMSATERSVLRQSLRETRKKLHCQVHYHKQVTNQCVTHTANLYILPSKIMIIQ